MKFVALLLLVVHAWNISVAQENCVIKKDDEGVKVYLCDNNKSNFKTIIVELEVPATLSQYAAQVLDIANYPNWQDRVEQQKIIKQISETELYYYAQVSAPWPASYRDYIFHLNLEQDSITKVLKMSLKEMPNYLPKVDGIIRIPFAESLLTITPISAKRVNVRFVLDIDPGGELPPWLVNMFAANTPWNTYVNFRQLIIEQGEQRQEVDFIQNYE